MILRKTLPIAAALAAQIIFGCAEEPNQPIDTGETSEVRELSVTCDGKCDGWGSIKSLWRERKDIDLGDLLSVTSGFATQELNDLLDLTDFAQISLGETEIFGLSEEAESDRTIQNLDELASGLAARFGERELTTKVNFLRRFHLSNSDDRYFAESRFKLGGSIDPRWGIETGGLAGASVRLGFEAGGEVEARVIVAAKSERSALLQAPLAAVKATRGFILPRSVEDVLNMKPGESFALSGEGDLAINVGVGVPILIATPATVLSYSFVVSAGVRTHLEGRLDVQLVRIEDDQVVVDVGVSNGHLRSAHVALDDAWGVAGLMENKVEVGGYDVDLGELLEKSVKKGLNRKLDLVSASASTAKSQSRITVARLRFDLGGVDEASDVSAALKQALRGDVRLAQALAHADSPHVTAEFDLARSGLSATSHAGIDFLGMRFFRQEAETIGTAVIQTPGGARTVFFNSLREESGRFYSSHGHSRTALAGLLFDAENQRQTIGEVNLFLELAEGDEKMERDKLVDQLDALVLSMGGAEAHAALAGSGNELQRYVETTCSGGSAFDPCFEEVLSDPTVVALREEGEKAVLAEISELSPELQNVVLAAANLRLTANATFEPSAQLVGPATSVQLQTRFDDASLAEILVATEASAFKFALQDYIASVAVDRSDEPGENLEQIEDAIKDARGDIDDMTEVFERRSGEYARIVAAERSAIESLGAIGPRALEVRFGVGADGRADYESATARSLPRARADIAASMVDELIASAEDLDNTHAAQAVVYTLMSLSPKARADVRLDVDMDLDDTFSQDFDHYREAGYAGFDAYGKGTETELIDGGLFDINALLEEK